MIKPKKLFKMNKVQLIEKIIPLLATYLNTHTDAQVEDLTLEVLNKLDDSNAKRVRCLINNIVFGDVEEYIKHAQINQVG